MRIVTIAALVVLHAGPAAAQEHRELERRMFELVNQDRVRVGLPPLRFSQTLSNVARGHSQDMVQSRFFEHRSPNTGDHGARLYRAGVAAKKSGENIARDVSVDDAEVHLMQSPGHRANILSDEFTHVGIGIVREGSNLFVTQNFIRPIRPLDPALAVKTMVAKINEKRAHARLPPLKLDPRLGDLCHRGSAAMNQAQKLSAPMVTAGVKRSGIRYYTIQVWVGLSPDPGKVLEAEFLTDPEINALGLGLAVNQTQENGLGNLWISMLAAEVP